MSESSVSKTAKLPKSNLDLPNKLGEPRISALSLSSIKAKKEMAANANTVVRHTQELPKEPFTLTEMLVQWNKYAQKIGDKGQKIMQSLLLISEPKLDGFKIIYELPNEGSKIDFEKDMNGLIGHLRGHLHNHDISIDVFVNETIETKRAFTDQDRYNRFIELNKNFDLLRTTFGLEFES